MKPAKKKLELQAAIFESLRLSPLITRILTAAPEMARIIIVLAASGAVKDAAMQERIENVALFLGAEKQISAANQKRGHE